MNILDRPWSESELPQRVEEAKLHRKHLKDRCLALISERKPYQNLFDELLQFDKDIWSKLREMGKEELLK